MIEPIRDDFDALVGWHDADSDDRLIGERHSDGVLE